MTTPPLHHPEVRRHRREHRGPWILLAALLATAPLQARAVGMSGVFAPENWKLINTNISQDPVGYDLLNNNYLYICQSSNAPVVAVGCTNNTYTSPGLDPPSVVNFSDQSLITGAMKNDGNLYLIGSDSASLGYEGAGSTGNSSYTSFYVTNGSSNPYQLEFTISFYGFADGQPTPSSPTFNILKSYSQTPYLTYTGDSYNELRNLTLLPGEQLTFQILTYNNSTSMTPSLAVTGFSSHQVPAPIPIFGSAAAFAYSRRLRHRIKLHHREGRPLLAK